MILGGCRDEIDSGSILPAKRICCMMHERGCAVLKRRKAKDDQGGERGCPGAKTRGKGEYF